MESFFVKNILRGLFKSFDMAVNVIWRKETYNKNVNFVFEELQLS